MGTRLPFCLVCLAVAAGGCRAQQQELERQWRPGPAIDWAVKLQEPLEDGVYWDASGGREDADHQELVTAALRCAESLGEETGLALVAFVPAEGITLGELDLSGTVGDALTAFSDAVGGSVFVKLDHGLVACVGTAVQLEEIRARPPDTLPPTLFYCESPEDGLALIGECWDLDVSADAVWLEGIAADMEDPFADEVDEWMRHEPAWMAEHREPVAFAEWVEDVATGFGGEVRRSEAGLAFRRVVDGTQLRRAAERMIEALRADTLPSMTAEASRLRRLGEPAVPVLLEALSQDQPALAQVIIPALGEIGSVEAVEPLLAVLEWPSRLQHEHYDDSHVEGLSASAVGALAKIGDARAATAIRRVIDDEEQLDHVRQAAWVALGCVDPLMLPEEEHARTVWTPFPRMKLSFVQDQDGRRWGSFGDEKHVSVGKVHKAENGATWAAFTFARYGGLSDIWVAHSPQGKEASEYIFTGCTVAQYRAHGPEATVTSFRVAGDEVRLGWARRDEKWDETRSLAELRADTDGDGLTDVLEMRLQTDPETADTDGDGLSDAEDGNPLVAPSPEPTDEELVIQAAFAHLHRYDESEQVKTLHISTDMRVEVYGYGGPILCCEPHRARELRDEVGCGFESVSISRQERLGEEWVDLPPVAFAEDGTLAWVKVSTYRDGLWGAGYHGILKKVGDRWVIVEWVMDWIS